MVIIWFESPRDDAASGSFFVSYQFQVAKGQQHETTEGSECWVLSTGLGSSPIDGLKHGSEHIANSVSHK